RAVIAYLPARALRRTWPEVVNVPCARIWAVIAPTPAKARPANARERTKTVAPGRQRPALPDTHTRPPGAITLGRTRKLGRVRDEDRLRVRTWRASGVACRFFASTEMDAVPVMPPAVAVIVLLPTVVALKVDGFAGFGENVPTTGESDQVGVTAT